MRSLHIDAPTTNATIINMIKTGDHLATFAIIRSSASRVDYGYAHLAWNDLLVAACEGGSEEMVSGMLQLINALPDAVMQRVSRDDALIAATLYHNTLCARFMVNNGARNVTYALFVACRNGYVDLAHYFVGRGARNFNAAFCAACISGNIECAQYIASLGDARRAIAEPTADDIRFIEQSNKMYEAYASTGATFESPRHESLDIISWNCALMSALKVAPMYAIKYIIEQAHVRHVRIAWDEIMYVAKEFCDDARIRDIREARFACGSTTGLY